MARERTRREVCGAVVSAFLLPLMSGCAAAPNEMDLARTIRAGAFERAISIAEALRAKAHDDADLQLAIGAIRFAQADFAGALRAFESAGSASSYLLSDLQRHSDDASLKTDIAPMQWFQLSTLRSGGPSLSPASFNFAITHETKVLPIIGDL